MRNIIFGLALAVCPVAFCETAAVAATNAVPELAVRYYPFHQGRMEKRYSPSACFCEKSDESIAQEETRRWQAFFRPFGVTWPAGATVAHVGAVDKLRVRNTPENLDKIATALDEIRREAPPPKLVEIEVRLIEVGQKALDELGPQLAAKKSAGARYDLDDFSKVDAAALERALVARPDADGSQPWKLVTDIGCETVGKRVTEYIYPTDYDVQLSCVANGKQASPTNGASCVLAAVEPQSFMMREAGTVIVATPWSWNEEDKTLELKLDAQIVDDPTWRDYGHKVPAPDGTTYDLPMEQPFFRVRCIDTRLNLVLGKTVLVSASAGKDKLLFGFVRATLP